MIDPSIIDEKIVEARHAASYAHDLLRYHTENINATTRKADGAIALTSFDASQFMLRLHEYVAAVADLKLLELIASPHFYAALMRSAGEEPQG